MKPPTSKFIVSNYFMKNKEYSRCHDVDFFELKILGQTTFSMLSKTMLG